MTDNIQLVGLLVGGLIFLVLIIVGMLAKLYVRSTKEMAFVRTGAGGQKVIADGGALVLPVLQEITPVNMKTLRLMVERRNEEALITLDRMRADVTAEFYVRTKKDASAIAQAAQSFGDKTLNPEELKILLQGKFVDALRSVAAGMDMQQLHEKRAEFVQSVQLTVAEDLSKNGLELESVSLTGFDQTSIEYFNENNAFDAQGLANVAAITEQKREERNRIEQDTRIAIETKNLESEKKSLTIRQEDEFARLEQERAISIQKAEQEALIKQQEAVRSREAREAEIEAQRKIEEARIASEKEVQAAEIEKKKQLETANILRQQSIDISQQESSIAVATKSEEKSKAEAQAAKARAIFVKEEEEVVTVRQVAEAERAKSVEVIKAKEVAERDAIAVTIAAEADKEAAQNLSEAELIKAKAEAEAVTIKAEADRTRHEVAAYGEKSINEAKNVLEQEIIDHELKKLIAQIAPELVAASAKPMENIDSIKILSGFGGVGSPGVAGTAGEGGEVAGSGSIPNQLVDAMMKHRLQIPVIDQMLQQLDIDPSQYPSLPKDLGAKS